MCAAICLAGRSFAAIFLILRCSQDYLNLAMPEPKAYPQIAQITQIKKLKIRAIIGLNPRPCCDHHAPNGVKAYTAGADDGQASLPKKAMQLRLGITLAIGWVKVGQN